MDTSPVEEGPGKPEPSSSEALRLTEIRRLHRLAIAEDYRPDIHSMYFSTLEWAALKRYGTWMQKLWKQELEPTTTAQRRFVEATHDRVVCTSRWEALWIKYLTNLGVRSFTRNTPDVTTRILGPTKTDEPTSEDPDVVETNGSKPPPPEAHDFDFDVYLYDSGDLIGSDDPYDRGAQTDSKAEDDEGEEGDDEALDEEGDAT